MPELPEVRVHAERLGDRYGGCTLSGFEALSFTALKTAGPSPDLALGRRLGGVDTRGKYLLLHFGTVTFVVHLMQGGRLKPDTKPRARPRGGLARWRFEETDPLLLTEAGTEKRAGVWVVADEGTDADVFAGLGPEADRVARDGLDTILDDAGGARLHGVLRDQRRLAGLGRRLANEICWTARLSPFAPAAKLDGAQRLALLDAIATTVTESISDERSRTEMVASAQRLAHVHHRTGQTCERCGDQIREVSYHAYDVNYCATCQTGGKVLADNTTSKFLK
ncbi:MAG: DNA-formamidopyrimidine glycosylase family protein [Microthrixaceae bacterium]